MTGTSGTDGKATVAVFGILGRKTVWLGPVGQGSLMKVVVNAYMSVLIEGVAETLELADRLGIGHQQLAEVIEGGPLDAPIADAKLTATHDRGKRNPGLARGTEGTGACQNSLSASLYAPTVQVVQRVSIRAPI